MKIAIVYNRDSQAVINLFGKQNREKYGLATISKIKQALKAQGHQVQAFEGDKNIINQLEEFMPSVISGERPGLVFNLSYGIQGRARYTHIPSILEMLGIPYVGSGPESHGIALDKVVTKMILQQRGLPTPKFMVMEKPDELLEEGLSWPLIVKPRDEAVSFGLKIVRNEAELRAGVKLIYDTFEGATLIEEYIEGLEVNVGLLGNYPVEALPPVELRFGSGEQIYTYEDKTKTSGRTIEMVCPAEIPIELTEKVQKLAVEAFKAIGCFDSARVDFRIDNEGNPYILEINSMASLGFGGSYVYAAKHIGLDYDKLVNKLIDVASQRYFGSAIVGQLPSRSSDKRQTIFNWVTRNRDKIEEELKMWTNMSSRTEDAVGISAVVRKLDERLAKLGLKQVEEFTNQRSTWMWQTETTAENQKTASTLLVVPIDIPVGQKVYPVQYRREAEWLYGEGIASSRAGITIAMHMLTALKHVRKLKNRKIAVFVYSDEGRGMRYSSGVLQKASAHYSQVLVMSPGFTSGKVIDQRRGLRKYKLLINGPSMRVGARTKDDVTRWFMERFPKIDALNSQVEKLSVALLEIQSERYSVLKPHQLQVTLGITYLKDSQANAAEKSIEYTLKSKDKEIDAKIEKLEERQPLLRKRGNKKMIDRLSCLSEEWKIPFEVESGLMPSAAGEVAKNTPVLCGISAAGKDMHTPQEAVKRGELLQRLLLLSLFLLEE